MATITTIRALDLQNTSFYYGVPTEVSETQITITAGAREGTYRGDFSYDSYGRVFGQLHSYEETLGGVQQFLVDNLNLDAYQVFLLSESNDASALYEYGLSGNDDLFGSEFADVLLGYAGNDLLVGKQGSDILYGNAGQDSLQGDDGADILVGGQGDDLLLGGNDFDSVVFSGAQSNYTVNISSDGVVRVNDRVANRDGLDTIVEVESLSFQNSTWALSSFSNAGALSEHEFTALAEMYIAYFNRAADSEGLLFWANALTREVSLEEAAELFFDQPETRATYSGSGETEEFVSSVYQNVLGREMDQAGADFWISVLESGAVSEGKFILEIIRGAKAPAEPDAPPAFTEQKALDVLYLSDKTDIGIYYSAVAGLSNVENAMSVMRLFDGSQASLIDAKSAIDAFAADANNALDGEFILSLVGVVDNPFADF